jgi:hypothetical protein
MLTRSTVSSSAPGSIVTTERIHHRSRPRRSVEEFHRLKGDQIGAALIAAMQSSPHREIEIEPGRAPTPVRGVDL